MNVPLQCFQPTLRLTGNRPEKLGFYAQERKVCAVLAQRYELVHVVPNPTYESVRDNH
jgi:hypothetical protein